MDCSDVPSVPYSEGDPAQCPERWRSHRARFQRDGFVVIPDLLGDAEWREYADEFVRHHRRRRPESYARYPEGGAEGGAGCAARSPAPELDAVQAMWEDSDVLRRLVFHPVVAAAAAALLGARGVRVLQDQANTKPPGGAATHVHQDQPYLPVAEPLTVAAWAPLVAGGSHAGNGQMGYVRGSHRCGLRWLPFRNDGAAGRPPGAVAWPGRGGGGVLDHPRVRRLADPAPVFVSVPPRAVAFHHGLCLHLSARNPSPRWRHALTTTYVADGCHAGSCMGIVIKPTHGHYMLRAGITHGQLIAGPGADEHMPLAFPRPAGAGLPPRPKLSPRLAAGVRGGRGFLPSPFPTEPRL